MSHWPPIPPLPPDAKPFVVAPAPDEVVEVQRISLVDGETIDDVIGRIKFVGPPVVYATQPFASPFVQLEPRDGAASPHIITGGER